MEKMIDRKKYFDTSNISDSEKIAKLTQIIEDLYINYEIKTLDVYMKNNKNFIIDIIKSK